MCAMEMEFVQGLTPVLVILDGPVFLVKQHHALEFFQTRQTFVMQMVHVLLQTPAHVILVTLDCSARFLFALAFQLINPLFVEAMALALQMIHAYAILDITGINVNTMIALVPFSITLRCVMEEDHA